MLVLLGETGRSSASAAASAISPNAAAGKAHQPLTRVLKMLSGVNSAMVRIRQRREILAKPAGSRLRGRLRERHGGADRAGHAHRAPHGLVGQRRQPGAQQLTSASANPRAKTERHRPRAAHRRSLVCNDLQTLEMGLAARAALMDSGFRSVVAYPLLVDRTPSAR
jgi:hypothetical protein